MYQLIRRSTALLSILWPYTPLTAVSRQTQQSRIDMAGTKTSSQDINDADVRLDHALSWALSASSMQDAGAQHVNRHNST